MADHRGLDMKEYAENGLADAAGLISRREYDLSIVKARQVIERLIRSYAAENNIIYDTLADTIERLYESRAINMTSRDACHTIRLYGNKAVHEAGCTDEDAQNAYYLLKNEIQTYLSRRNVSVDRTPVKVERTSFAGRERSQSAGMRGIEEYRREAGEPASSTDSYSEGPRRSSSSQRRDERGGQRRSERGGANRQRQQREPERGGITIYDILRVLIPVIVVILLVIIIRSLLPSRTAEPETTTAPIESTVPETSSEPETEPETTTEAETEPAVVEYRIKGDSVNVRYADNQNRIYTQLSNGTAIGTVTPLEGTDFVQFTLDGVNVVVRSDFIEPIGSGN